MGIGLYYYRARWYDAHVGRFVSADTIVPEPTNPQALNRYSYVVNNPLVLVDPSGHAYIDHAGGGGIISTPTIPAWSPTPEYSEWYSPNSSYSGCFRCHAAVSNGQAALTNNELEASYARMESTQNTTIEIALRFFEPIDYLYTARNCLHSGSDPEEVYWTTVPFAAGTFGKMDDIAALGKSRYLDKFSSDVGAQNYNNWQEIAGGSLIRKEDLKAFVLGGGTAGPNYFFDFEFPTAMNNASRIHFNLRGIDNVDEAVRLGSYNNPRVYGWTETELHQIITNRKWYDKTEFHNGPAPDFLGE